MHHRARHRIARTLAGLVALATLTFALAQDDTEIVLSIGSRGFGQAAPVLIETCEEQIGGIDVEWNRISDVPNESRSVYVTNFTARNDDPDVIAVDVIWPGDFAGRGWIEPLDAYFTDEELSEFVEGFLSAAQIDGSTYGIPLYIDGIHLFYRADLLEAYGFEPPTTWEELIHQANTIVEGEDDPDLHGFVSMWAKIEGLFMNWLAFYQGAGGSFVDENGDVNVDSEAGLHALRTMLDILYDEELAPESILTYRPDDARILFQQGRSVFLMVQDFVLEPLTSEDSPVRDDVGFTRVPYFEGHEDADTTVIGGFLLAVNAYSDAKEASAELIRCMTSYESQVQATLLQGKVPTRPAVYEHPAVQEERPTVAALGDNFLYSFARPSAETGTAYPRVSEIMQTELSAALLQQKTPEQALRDAQRQIESVLP